MAPPFPRPKRKPVDEKAKKRIFVRRKVCRFCADPKVQADYKEAALLRHFVSERGKLVPRRITGNCALHQRQVATAIRRARMIALIPFAVTGK
jgi:small subunit ribosomal protein S18